MSGSTFVGLQHTENCIKIHYVLILSNLHADNAVGNVYNAVRKYKTAKFVPYIYPAGLRSERRLVWMPPSSPQPLLVQTVLRKSELIYSMMLKLPERLFIPDSWPKFHCVSISFALNQI